MAELVIREGGELLRLRDLRGEAEQRCSTNRGTLKGKALEQARLVYLKSCGCCGQQFQGIAKAVFCSNACRQKTKRAKARAEIDTIA